MNAFGWTPPELIEAFCIVKKKLDERPHLANREILGYRNSVLKKYKAIERKDFLDGPNIIGPAGELVVLERLISAESMQNVWNTLNSKIIKFKPQRCNSWYGNVTGFTPALNLFSACSEALQGWSNTPNLSRKALDDHYRKIGKQTKALIMLLLKTYDPELVALDKYIDEDKLKSISKHLDVSSFPDMPREVWMRVCIYSGLRTIPELLFKLMNRSMDSSRRSSGVGQPNAPNALEVFFIRHLTKYFLRAYGEPLHSCVATIANVVVLSDTDDQNVRSLYFLDHSDKKIKGRKRKTAKN